MHLEEIREQVLSEYGMRILLESALGIGLVVFNNEKYTITKTGTYIHNDPLTNVNMDFIHDVCYKGLFSLDKSIETGKPEGLKNLETGIPFMKVFRTACPDVQKSWFTFDHFFSDLAFPRHCPMYIQMALKKYWTLVAIPANGLLPAPSLQRILKLPLWICPVN